MALTHEQKASRLFKKSVGAAETLTTRDFFEEPKLGKNAILPSQIWAEADKIPNTAPTLSNGQTLGVVQYIDKLSLNHIAGSTNLSYSHDSLKNTIPFNFGDGTYNYKLYKSDGTTTIAFGEGDWLLDTEAGVLTFYGSLPTLVSSVLPPQISFYKYVGALGLPSGTTSGLNVHDSVRCATTGVTDATYSTSTSGYTSLPSNIDGVTSFSNGDRILIKNQTTAYQNGIFVVSGSTLVRAIDSDGTPSGEVSLNDYTFVTSGSTLVATSWVIGSSDTPDSNGIIRPGVDSQNWILFSTSKEYTGDGNAIKLNGSTFYLDLDDTGIYGSGLYQSVDGVRLSDTITSNISNSITGITSLSTTLSNEILNTISGFTSLESSINITGITSNITSLSTAISSITLSDTSLTTAISSEISTRTADDSSLSTAISSEISTRTADDSSLSTAISSEISTRTADDSSLSTAISSEISTRTADDSSLSTALSLEIYNTITGITSLETSINNIDIPTGVTSGITSLSTAISSEISTRTADDSSLSTAISTEISNNVLSFISLETSINITGITSNITSLSTAVSSGDNSLSTAISSEISTRTADDSSLSTAISSEISTRTASDISLATALDNFSGVTSQTAGSGLTFNTSEKTLNVNVDNYTIKIVNDEVRGSQMWIQTDKLTTIATGTGATNITLTYDPITPVQVFINGIEYLVNIGATSSGIDKPFYFDTLIPTVGSILYFNATEAGFGLESGIDLIAVKYQYIDLT